MAPSSPSFRVHGFSTRVTMRLLSCSWLTAFQESSIIKSFSFLLSLVSIYAINTGRLQVHPVVGSCPFCSPTLEVSSIYSNNQNLSCYPNSIRFSSAMSEAKKKEDVQFVLSRMKYYDKHPKKSQRFMDIFPIFTSTRATEIVISDLIEYIRSKNDVEKEVAVIVGPEAEGFLVGPLVASRLGLPFVPARKQGKLPGDIVQEKYHKWSGSDVLEMQTGAFDEVDTSKGAIIVDDSGKCRCPLTSLLVDLGWVDIWKC